MKPPPRKKRARPLRSPAGKNRIVAWPFPLFGNPGGEAGALALHDALFESLADHAGEPESRMRGVAEATSLEVVEFVEPEDLLGWREGMRALLSAIRADGDFPVVLGANHLVALPILEWYAARDERVCVVQFDAHLDAYDLAQSRERLHHGNFLLHLERRPGFSIVNVGHRDLTLEPARVAEHFDRAWGIEEIAARPIDAVTAEIVAYAREFDIVHLDIDVDVLDPSIMAAVGTPMPCGLSSQQLLAIALGLFAGKVGGISISEYNAVLDGDGRGKHLLTWLVERLLLRRAGG